MVETIIDYSLGPHGRFLSEIYQDHQFVVNLVVVGIAMTHLFFVKRKKKATSN